MKKNLLPLFFLLSSFFLTLPNLCAQSGTLDSIFYKIPFQADILSTYNLLLTNKSFSLVELDTVQTNKSSVKFEVKAKNLIPNKANKITYTKSAFNINGFGKTQDECGKYSSCIKFSYKANGAAELDCNRMLTFLQNRLNPKNTLTLKTFEGVRYGYQFHLSENAYCNYIILTFSQQPGMGFVEVFYR